MNDRSKFFSEDNGYNEPRRGKNVKNSLDKKRDLVHDNHSDLREKVMELMKHYQGLKSEDK